MFGAGRKFHFPGTKLGYCVYRRAGRASVLSLGVTLKGASSESDTQLELALAGDESALAALFGKYRNRLRQMVRLRLDRRLQGRIDPSDVLQEAYVDITQQLPHFAAKQDDISFFLWARLVTGQRMMRLHRQHLGAEMRNVCHEVSLHHGSLPRATSVSLAAQLLGKFTSAAQIAIRAELRLKLQEALNSMEDVDREVIALRHFEELTNNEVAEVLQLSKAAASNRYVRAMARLQEVLKTIPGFLDSVS